jgi:predicted RNase H-like HicB family nuclease
MGANIMNNYIFPGVFIYNDNGVSVYFPDLDGCLSSGENEIQAFFNAKEALTSHLYSMEQKHASIPKPSKIKDFKLTKDEQAVYIEAFMPAFRAKQSKKFVKKTLTIPEWLNILAEKEGINFSQVLQAALKLILQRET